MNNVISIHPLMEKFQSIEGAIVGEGPKHPTSSHPEMQEQIDDFLSEYNFLRKDPSYVDFLECYSGALIDSPDGNIFVDIFGFLEDVSLHLRNGEGSVVDENGYFDFCSAVVRVRNTGDTNKDNIDIGVGFSFDATGARQWGIYRSIEGAECKWYCNSFQEWLKKFVEREKSLIDPN
jgi:hypothetical protein